MSDSLNDSSVGDLSQIESEDFDDTSGKSLTSLQRAALFLQQPMRTATNRNHSLDYRRESLQEMVDNDPRRYYDIDKLRKESVELLIQTNKLFQPTRKQTLKKYGFKN